MYSHKSSHIICWEGLERKKKKERERERNRPYGKKNKKHERVIADIDGVCEFNFVIAD